MQIFDDIVKGHWGVRNVPNIIIYLLFFFGHIARCSVFKVISRYSRNSGIVLLLVLVVSSQTSFRYCLSMAAIISQINDLLISSVSLDFLTRLHGALAVF